MKQYDVYTISNSGKVEFVGVFEASTPFAAMDRAGMKNCTMKALPTGSDKAIKFAAENK